MCAVDLSSPAIFGIIGDAHAAFEVPVIEAGLHLANPPDANTRFPASLRNGTVVFMPAAMFVIISLTRILEKMIPVAAFRHNALSFSADTGFPV